MSASEFYQLADLISKGYTLPHALRSVARGYHNQYEVPLWDDYLGDLSAASARGVPADPVWDVFRGNIRGWNFAVNDELFVQFHIKHDFLVDSEIFPHMHWSTDAASPSGVTKWGFEYTIAQRLDDVPEAFPATSTVYVEDTCTSQYAHMVSEVTEGISDDSLQVDAIMLMRVFRDTASSSDNAFGFLVDLHYQKDRAGTKNRAPNFYV